MLGVSLRLAQSAVDGRWREERKWCSPGDGDAGPRRGHMPPQLMDTMSCRHQEPREQSDQMGRLMEERECAAPLAPCVPHTAQTPRCPPVTTVLHASRPVSQCSRVHLPTLPLRI